MNVDEKKRIADEKKRIAEIEARLNGIRYSEELQGYATPAIISFLRTRAVLVFTDSIAECFANAPTDIRFLLTLVRQQAAYIDEVAPILAVHGLTGTGLPGKYERSKDD